MLESLLLEEQRARRIASHLYANVIKHRIRHGDCIFTENGEVVTESWATLIGILLDNIEEDLRKIK